MLTHDLARKYYSPWMTLARLEGLGLSLREMARLSGLTVRQVRTAVANPAYQEFRDAKQAMRVSAMDRRFAEDNEAMAARLREMVPAALNVLERALCNPNLTVAVGAAREVLDRDARFSRSANLNVEYKISEAEIERAREIARSMRLAQEREAKLNESDRESPKPN